MEAHQERVVAELSARAHELDKLQKFFKTDTFAKLGDEEKHLMLSQEEAMKELTDVLRKRIDLWRKTSRSSLASLKFFDDRLAGDDRLENLKSVEVDLLRSIIVDMANDKRVQAEFGLQLLASSSEEMRTAVHRAMQHSIPHGTGSLIGWPGTVSIANDAYESLRRCFEAKT